MKQPISFIEFFCGIGGLAACLPHTSSSISIDINRTGLAIHELNFSGATLCKTIESLKPEDLADTAADLWWMSPPCQPYTRRGQQRDLDDPRTAGFKNMTSLVRELRPPKLAMENVPEFADSASRNQLVNTLTECGYQFAETILCPTRLGAVNRRRRYYLIASFAPLARWNPPLPIAMELKLEQGVDHQRFAIPQKWMSGYSSAIHVVNQDAADGQRQSAKCFESTTCFTSAYGRSPVRSGSYLKSEQGVRFFTPREILWQLGFSASFQLPEMLPEKLWPLTGNTLALPAVKYVLAHLLLE